MPNTRTRAREHAIQELRGEESQPDSPASENNGESAQTAAHDFRGDSGDRTRTDEYPEPLDT